MITCDSCETVGVSRAIEVLNVGMMSPRLPYSQLGSPRQIGKIDGSRFVDFGRFVAAAPGRSPPIAANHLSDVPCPLPRLIERRAGLFAQFGRE